MARYRNSGKRSSNKSKHKHYKGFTKFRNSKKSRVFVPNKRNQSYYINKKGLQENAIKLIFFLFFGCVLALFISLFFDNVPDYVFLIIVVFPPFWIMMHLYPLTLSHIKMIEKIVISFINKK